MTKKDSLIAYFIRSLTGAWLLVKLDARGMTYFDNSADGFWKSFWAILLSAPMFFIWLNTSYEMAVEQGYQGPIEANIIGFVLGLPLFALVMVFFTKFLKIDAHYSTMIIAYNWLSVVVYYLTMPLDLLMRTGLLPQQIGTLVTMAAIFYLQLYVTWFMFKHALRISGWLAVGVLAFEFLFSLSVMMVLVRLFS